jgi:hypothetical protein
MVQETCGTFRGLIFGPPQDLTERISVELRAELVRTPYQEMNFEAILDWAARTSGFSAGASGSFLADLRRDIGQAAGRMLALDRVMACILY